MKVEPVLTEKSLDLAKEGIYTFFVDRKLNKYQIRNMINDIYDVHVTRVRTVKVPGERKKNFKGEVRIVKPRKKAMVNLKEKESMERKSLKLLSALKEESPGKTARDMARLKMAKGNWTSLLE